jgi:Fic family protein
MSKFETIDYSQIIPKLTELDETIQDLLNGAKSLPITSYIDEVVKIHHEMTVIHPFSDGNGRVTRAFLNWLFIVRKLPPVYIKYEQKDKYIDALSTADQTGNFDSLYEIFYREVLRSMIQLNTKFI